MLLMSADHALLLFCSDASAHNRGRTKKDAKRHAFHGAIPFFGNRSGRLLICRPWLKTIPSRPSLVQEESSLPTCHASVKGHQTRNSSHSLGQKSWVRETSQIGSMRKPPKAAKHWAPRQNNSPPLCLILQIQVRNGQFCVH